MIVRSPDGLPGVTAASLSKNVIEDIPKHAASVIGAGSLNVSFVSVENREDAVPFVALDGSVDNMLRLKIDRGRALTVLDQNERHVVLGHDIAVNLAKASARPVLIGDSLMVGETYYKVVGVLQSGTFPAGLPMQVNNSIFLRKSAIQAATENETGVIRVAITRSTEEVSAEIQSYLSPLLGGRNAVIEAPTLLLATVSGQTDFAEDDDGRDGAYGHAPGWSRHAEYAVGRSKTAST